MSGLSYNPVMSSPDAGGGPDVYSAGEVATLCGVARATVLRWISDAKLRSFSLPSGHYRIRRGDLVNFLRQFKIPVPAALERKPRVLVVDDDPEIVGLVREALMLDEDLRVEVTAATGGLEACLKVGGERPDLMILDLKMGEVNGQDVARVLVSHEEFRLTRILVITGYATAQVLKELKDMGIREILHKPFDIRELSSRVKAMLNPA